MNFQMFRCKGATWYKRGHKLAPVALIPNLVTLQCKGYKIFSALARTVNVKSTMFTPRGGGTETHM